MAERSHDRATQAGQSPEEARSGTRSAPSVPNSGGLIARDVLVAHGHAGNAAVGALIARARLQRQPPAAPPTGATGATETKAGEKSDSAGDYTITIAGVGTIPLLTFSLSGGNEIVATKEMDGHSAKLMQLAAEGKSLGEVRIVLRQGKETHTIKVLNAVISSYQTGGGTGDKPMDTFGLNGTIEHELSPEAESTGAGSGAPAAPPPSG